MLRLSACPIALGILLSVSVANCFAEGALATSRDRQGFWFGISYNKNTIPEARSNAMQSCSQRGQGCSVVATFRNSCIAVIFWRGPGRSGYGWAVRSTAAEAQNAAMSSCRSQSPYCEMKTSSCDTVDEAAIAAQRRLAQEQAAAEANRRRIEAEQAARDAEERTKRANEATRRASSQTPPWRADPATGISNNKAAGLALLALIAISVVILKQGYPKLAGFTALIMPVSSLLIYVLTGIEVKDHVTLYELPLFAPFFGGALVAALVYKLHA